jgi:PPOX class probable F420-dependent enzyme
MGALNSAARELIRSGAVGHLVTINPDGSPQVAVVWVGIDGEELVAAHLDGGQQKLKNVRRDARVAVSFEAPTANDVGMRHYLVVYGQARVTEGGAPELLHELAQIHVGPGTQFPPMPNPPPGFITHIAVERVAGNGPWWD